MVEDRQKSSAPREVSLGDVLGAYVVERKLGSGGMADVYFAVHQELSRPAALKVLRSALATDDVHLQRFMQEARAAAGLIHPNIVQVYDVGCHDGLHYIAGEYIPGCNLREYLTGAPSSQDEIHATTLQESGVSSEPSKLESGEQPLAESAADGQNSRSKFESGGRQSEIKETISILLQVLAALKKSAAAGIVHRDIKPENIMLTPEGDAKVADFGLARVLLGDDPNLTRAGTTLGTPMYMSPEQIQDGEVDIRSDLYSLGVTLYHMLAGRPPFKGDTPLALAMQHVQAEPPLIQSVRPDIPNSLATIVHRLLKKSQADRYATPGEVLEALRNARSVDLSEYWPEQTVPLPEVRQETHAGIYHETLVLAQRLQSRRGKSSTLLRWAVVAACLIVAFAIGSWGAAKPPMLSGVVEANPTPRESDAYSQLKAALLAGQVSLKRLEAVIDYHGDSGDRYWVDWARIQIARLNQNNGDIDKAKTSLEKLSGEGRVEPFHKVLAHLLLADCASGKEREAELVEAARLYQPLNATQKRHVNDFANCLDEQTSEGWVVMVD